MLSKHALIDNNLGECMGKKKESKSGLTSAAGLMRYYDADKSAIAINPKAVLIASLVVAVMVLALNAYYGVWP